MAGGTWSIEVDASDLIWKVDRLKENMTQEQFERAMYGIFKDTSRHVKKILKEDTRRYYYVKAGDVTAAVQSPQVSYGGGGVGCVIPIRGTRGTVGGRYRASGGSHGGKAARRHRRQNIKAKVVKAGDSVMPDRMPGSYGGNPPFRNLGSGSSLAWTRKTSARYPIMPVYSMSIPQMPTNRAEADVQKDIKDYLEKRMDQRFRSLIMNGI